MHLSLSLCKNEYIYIYTYLYIYIYIYIYCVCVKGMYALISAYVYTRTGDMHIYIYT